MVRLEEETRTNQYIVAERLPKEVDTRKKTLLDLQKVVAEPAMGQSDLEKLHQQVRGCYTCTGIGKLLEPFFSCLIGGYFRWGKISQKCWQDLSRGGDFHDISPIYLVNSYGFYFPTGEIFRE